MITARRIPVTITIQPWFHDHAFAGRAILPAVETLILLAGTVRKYWPEVDVRLMTMARFARFLEIPQGAEFIKAMIECTRENSGAIRAGLFSRVKFKAMTRIIEHGEVLFPVTTINNVDRAGKTIENPPTGETVKEIRADKIYRQLIPFGPAYRTLKETLLLSKETARGRLRAPSFPLSGSVAEILGSPFPFDGALHAACVHGQQHVNFVPFPVGFNKRIISKPTRPDTWYGATVIARSRVGDELLFDLQIFDEENVLYESVTGIRMRNVLQ